MSKSQITLYRSLEALVGADHIIEGPALRIDGLRPALEVKPGSAEQVAGVLRACAELDAAVVPAGLGTWLESGNPLRRADVVLSLQRMSRIIEYSPPDLTIIVEAGLALTELNARTAIARQWLPLDPPGAGEASVGAVAACASSGPLRAMFGTPRDYVIGLRLAHTDGSESKSGGRVAKNVAGYDMNKLYVGSFGTLAILTEVIFKLRPLPELAQTIIVTSGDAESLARTAASLRASHLQPASVFLVKGAGDKLALGSGDRALVIRFVESEAAVKYQVEHARRLLDEKSRAETLDQAEADTVWKRLADLDRAANNAVSMSVPAAVAPFAFESGLSICPDSVAAADLGAGIIRMAFESAEESAVESITRLRREATSRGGSLFVERALTGARARVDAWGETGGTGVLMRQIKTRFDPQSILNPGRFVEGI